MTGSREQGYRAAGFGGEIGFGLKAALVVVDMVMAYFEVSSPLYAGVESAVVSNTRLVEAAYRKQVPVIFTRPLFEEALAAGVYVRKVPALKLLGPNSPLSALEPSLPAQRATVMMKRFPSAFHQTDLLANLRSLGVDTVIITGLTTSGCIRATAMDTQVHGLTAIVVREAVGDRDQRQHEANLFDINAKLGDVRTEAETLAWLDGC